MRDPCAGGSRDSRWWPFCGDATRSTLKPMLAGSDCLSIESPHPSPLSASRGFFGSRPFSRANELLAQLGAEPIDWQLP